MKKILPITLFLLSFCVIAYAQDVGTAVGINPDLQQGHQDDVTKLSSRQQKEEQLRLQLTDKRLQAANQLQRVKQWYNSQLNYLSINDGWHSAYATDNYLYISPISVKVVGGRAAIIGKTSVSTSTIVERGRCQITAMDNDKKMHTLTIYFIQ